MESMALHLLHCTISALLALTALTVTLISRSAAAGDQVLILLKVTTATISPAVSQHDQRGSNRDFVIEVKH